jgi:hypothetical protein
VRKLESCKPANSVLPGIALLASLFSCRFCQLIQCYHYHKSMAMYGLAALHDLVLLLLLPLLLLQETAALAAVCWTARSLTLASAATWTARILRTLASSGTRCHHIY